MYIKMPYDVELIVKNRLKVIAKQLSAINEAIYKARDNANWLRADYLESKYKELDKEEDKLRSLLY